MEIKTVSLLVVLVWTNCAQAARPLTRILGGAPTSIERYPILAQLLVDAWGTQQYSQYCAGVILTVRHVISTAHCYQINSNTGKDYSIPNFWKIRVGSSYRTRGGVLHNVKAIYPHPSFEKNLYNNDIAIVIASKSFVLGASVRQGTISKPGYDIKTQSLATLVGWGVMESGGTQPDQLQYVQLRKIDQNICRNRYQNISAKITDAMMCAGAMEGGIDGCYGDSGGPLLFNGVVVGLMSFGYSCGHPYYPGVYTKVAHLSDWVVKTVYSTSSMWLQ